ncbi:NAD-dependent epimerase/dehydratase family protein [Candidatus Parcubacteria bacterium]|nr:MAG: NAD-dependent epimerase/dehydratase family protein [Candidatus Parcubacteria bacterium]
MKRAIFDTKNVLVTGGAGFIGSNLCDRLVSGAKVICVDNFITGKEKNIDHLLANPNFRFIKHDITKPLDLENLPELQKFKIQFQGIQEIYHLACPTSPKRFEEHKMLIADTLSIGTKNMLDLAVKYDAKFLLFSSSVVYGPRRSDNEKISETDLGQVDILSERAVYDEGKRFAETLTKTYRDVYNIDAKIIRPFRIYGPRMALGEGHMISDFINDALDGKDLEIFGDKDFNTSLCYVSDLIDAALKLMETEYFGPYNIGSDVDVNLYELAQKIIKLTGSKSKITFKEKLLFMTPLCLPNIAKARDDLGWLPIVTLEKGLDWTIHDLRASKGLKGVEHAI